MDTTDTVARDAIPWVEAKSLRCLYVLLGINPYAGYSILSSKFDNAIKLSIEQVWHSAISKASNPIFLTFPA
jgi:hypothetical protein